MSLLINESYANTNQPLWLSTSGNPIIDGNLTVEGEMAAGRVVSTRQLGIGSFVCEDELGTIKGSMLITGAGTAAPPAGDLMISTTQKVRFNQVGSDGFNTSFTPSAPGSNLDSLVVGGTTSTRVLKMLDAGPAAVVGTGTLTAGTVTINTTACLGPTSYIIVSRTAVNASTALGAIRVQTKNVGNFVVSSCSLAAPPGTEVNDESSFDWMIINPA